MKLVIISDTHMRHNRIKVPNGDVLIHCGDFTNSGTLLEALNAGRWFREQPHEHKVFIAGNHDWLAENDGTAWARAFGVASGTIYLEDSGVEIEGVKFWGSPVQPIFQNWAFNREEDIRKIHWKKIPPDTDVLITHCPPYGDLDAVNGGPHLGCRFLEERVKEVQPKIHAFGHIHDAYGNTLIVDPAGNNPDMIAVNASMVDESYTPRKNAAWELEL